MAVTWHKLAFEADVIKKTFMSGKGDLIYASAPGVAARLPLGTDDFILVVATDVPAWETPASASAHVLSTSGGGAVHTVPDGAVDFNLNIATDMRFMNIDEEANLPTVGVALGQVVYCVAEESLHICDSAS
jgi:hypothetical protein